MNTWKIVAVATLAIIGVALMTASVFAYAGAQTTYTPYSPNGYGQIPAGGMMSGANPSYGGYQYPNGYPQQGSFPQPYGQCSGSSRCCH